jgi:asparagine synthase (glutamine-hydrolysing)
MCGIAGIIHNDSVIVDNDTVLHRKQQVERMMHSLVHRGPDGAGFWANDAAQVIFGHRRLAIIDLSQQAAQPMHYNNQFTIVYNGEIYNYIELRRQLQGMGYVFATQSDTEVILKAYACYRENCLQYLDGMFAFAIWDEQEQSLFAARDRLGEKPFFYHQHNNTFSFASEMKALWASGIKNQPDLSRWLAYIGLGNTQNTQYAASTFYTNIFQLPPASYLLLDHNKITVRSYWSLNNQLPIAASVEATDKKFMHLLQQSVEQRLRSDVSVGASLSGGLDSASMVALMTQCSAQVKPVTFSAVFPGFEKDESKYIKEITTAFGLLNHSVTPNADQFINDIKTLCYHQEEPFQSSSVYAQYKVYELAAEQGVKVLLDGQGADETLAGYPRYHAWYWQQLISEWKWRLFQAERKAVVGKQIHVVWGWKNYLAAAFPAMAAGQLQNSDVKRILAHTGLHPDFVQAYLHQAQIHQRPVVNQLNDILHYNTTEYGLGELLRYADRNSMCHGVEVRLPFLSYELLEFIFSLPAHYKIHDGWTKWILRKNMVPYLPASVVWRTDKVGYEPPQKTWMQEPQLKDYLHESKKKLVKNKILQAAVLNTHNEALDAHAADNFDWRYLLAANMM